ncbi:MAG: sugar phosphate isomerase/epimerase [Planctomycetales bacterium]|nr:sugar phosphate isomerase/epimerase [Planctomycetales bacterium]
MKLAICNETFQDWPFDRAFGYAHELGYEGIEIAPFTIDTDARAISAARRAEVKKQAEMAGLEVVGLHWLLAKTDGYYLTSPDAVVRRQTAEYVSELARLCRDLGGKVMVFGSPQQRNLLPGVTLQQATDHAVDVLTQVLPTLEQHDVTIALEPLGPQEGDFWTTADETALTIDRIQSPHIQLHLDVKAMSSERKAIPDIIEAHASHLAHFHANDPNRRGPGMGEVEFEPILQTLVDVGYQGWLSVEVFDYDPGIERLPCESIQYLHQCLDRLAR